MEKPKIKHSLNNPYLYALAAAFLFTAFCITTCIRLDLFTSLTPIAYSADSPVDRYYEDDTRYVACHADELHYSGYDYLNHGRIKGHYYYTLIDNVCTVYLISSKYIKTPDEPPLMLSSAVFTATLRKNDASLKPLLEYMASDLNWDYAGISKYTSPILISQYHYNAALYILIACITFAGIAVTLFLFLCALRHCKTIKHPL